MPRSVSLPPSPTTGRSKPQNIQELAQIAGVSTATVSRALAGTGNLSPATRERIRGLADELGFRPSTMARNLRVGRTGAIGVVVPMGHERSQHLSDPFFMTMLGSIADLLVESGYDLLLSRVVPTQPSWLQAIVDAGRVDGLIVIGQSDQAAAIEAVARDYRPIAVWGAVGGGQSYSVVGSDNQRGGRIGTEHLLQQGCRRLAFFGDPRVPEVEQRLRGFRAAIREHGDGAVGALLPVHFNPQEALSAISEYLALAERIDGIFAASDTIAMMAIQALDLQGRSVPGDVKVLGFDDLDLARHTTPPLSSVRQDLAGGAGALVDALRSRMVDGPVQTVVLEPTLTVRASTAN